jgi:hypothetical protein
VVGGFDPVDVLRDPVAFFFGDELSVAERFPVVAALATAAASLPVALALLDLVFE